MINHWPISVIATLPFEANAGENIYRAQNDLSCAFVAGISLLIFDPVISIIIQPTVSSYRQRMIFFKGLYMFSIIIFIYLVNLIFIVLIMHNLFLQFIYFIDSCANIIDLRIRLSKTLVQQIYNKQAVKKYDN